MSFRCMSLVRVWLLVAVVGVGALTTTACNSGGVAHRVSEDAVSRVTGQDRLRLDAARAKLQKATQQKAGVGNEEAQANRAVQDAGKGVADAEKELIEYDKKRKALEQKLEQAKRYQAFREQQTELFGLRRKVLAADEVVAAAEYELVKFELVGRVESGSEEAFKTRLSDFRAQLQDAKMAAASARSEYNQKNARVQQMGQEFRRR